MAEVVCAAMDSITGGVVNPPEQQQSFPHLNRLPTELLDHILELLTLSSEDQRALRQTSRRLSEIATRHVFRRIRLSRLREDLVAFVNITEKPYLAVVVKEVIWYELDLEIFWPLSEDNFPDTETDYWIRKIDTLVKSDDVFWLPRVDYDFNTSLLVVHAWDFWERVDDFDVRFLRALSKAPAIDSVIFRPMPTSRVLSTTDYPIRAGMLESFDGQVRGARVGFETFLLPALKTRTASIKRLFMADSNSPSMANLGCLRMHDATAFEQLTTIDLCLYLPDSKRNVLVACLQAAKNLTSLSICFGCHGSGTYKAFDAILGSLTWPYLTKLKVAECFTTWEVLARFMSKHVALRDLTLHRCFLAPEDLDGVQDLRDRLNSNLSTITILDSHNWVDATCQERYLLPLRNDGFQLPRVSLDQKTTRTQPKSAWKDPESPGSGDDDDDDDDDDEAWRVKPRWCWARYCGLFYYWPCQDNCKSTLPTNQWCFTRESGERALGTEPLEFWEDWNASKNAGDNATPTPFGPRFDEAYAETYEGRCLCSRTFELIAFFQFDEAGDLEAMLAVPIQCEEAMDMTSRDLAGGSDKGTCSKCWALEERLGGSWAALRAVLEEARIIDPIFDEE